MQGETYTTKAIPGGGQLLGRVVRAFRLDQVAVGGKRAAKSLNKRGIKDWFAGKRVKEETEAEAIAAVAAAVLQADIVPLAEALRFTGHAETMVAGAVRSMLFCFDRLAMNLRATLRPSDDLASGLLGLMRFMALDLGVRYGALSRLGFLAPATNVSIYWADPHCRQQMLQDAAELWDSMSAFAREVGVEPTTAARWVSGEILPEDDHLGAIAAALARRPSEIPDAEATLTEAQKTRQAHCTYRRAFGLTQIFCDLAQAVGLSGDIH